MIYIGIDVGKKGAIARVSAKGECRVYPQPLLGKQPDECAMANFLRYGNTGGTEPVGHYRRAYIEKAQAMPKQGVTSMFSYGTLFGMWRGMLVALGIPYEIIPPRTWQKVMLSGVQRDDTKAASILVAKRLFPGVNLLPTPKCRKHSDGMADALNIAEYGRRTYLGARQAGGDDG